MGMEGIIVYRVEAGVGVGAVRPDQGPSSHGGARLTRMIQRRVETLHMIYIELILSIGGRCGIGRFNQERVPTCRYANDEQESTQ